MANKLERDMKKREKGFRNMEIEVQLTNIIINTEKSKLTLVFYSPETTGEYKKHYQIEEAKGKIDFNRAMIALGCTKRNYGKWLSRMAKLGVTARVSVTDKGFIRMIKVMSKEKKEIIKKSLFLDSIEGLSEADRDFLMELTLDVLRKEFGQ